ncbi:MAG: hypothetical protein PHI28_19965 [Mangrovibacterium sp.]|nr:hypothetical protein [Mangrovibacterium sp.]
MNNSCYDGKLKHRLFDDGTEVMVPEISVHEIVSFELEPGSPDTTDNDDVFAVKMLNNGKRSNSSMMKHLERGCDHHQKSQYVTQVYVSGIDLGTSMACYTPVEFPGHQCPEIWR